jgi:hypothetical protein
MSRGDEVHLKIKSASMPFFSVIVGTEVLGEFEPEIRRVLSQRRFGLRVLCLCTCCATCTPSFGEYGLRSRSYSGPRPHPYGT